MKVKSLLLISVSAAVLFLIFISLFGVTFGIIFIMMNLFFVLLLYYFSQNLKKEWWKTIYRAALIVYGLFLFSFGAVQFFLIMESSRKIPENIDYVVILGAGLKGEEPSQTLKSRLETGVEYLHDHPEIPVIVSGGQGEGEDIAESTAMFRYLTAHGISQDRITEENQSTTTWENLQNSQDILKLEGAADGQILIITSDYHVFRARLTGEQLGLNCSGMGGESGFFIKINYMIREYFAVVKALVIGGA
ncbi:MAG: YdcF family protein [Bacillota bacterium]